MDNGIKKQLESNLVPNFWRLFRGSARKGRFSLVSKGILLKSAGIAGVAMFVCAKLFWFPKNPLILLIIFLIAVILISSLMTSGKAESLKERDAFGNEIDQSNVYGTGRRMTYEQKVRFLDMFDERHPKGTILGWDPETETALGIPDNNRPFHRSLDHRHMLVTGASGRGKSKFLKDRHRQVLMQGFSDVYLDPKGELTEDVVFPCADAMGYMNRWLFRFRKQDIHLSNKMDLLKQIRTAIYPEVEANWLAGMILGFREKADDKEYWADSAKSLLALSLLAAARCEGYVSIETYMDIGDSFGEIEEKGTWKTASKVFSYTAAEVLAYFRYLMSISPENEDLLRSNFNTWIGDKRNYEGHVSSVQKKIRILAQSGVAEVFSEDEVDFDRLVSEPSTLGLIYDIPPQDFAPAMNLVLQLVTAAILRKKTKHNISIILEELKITGVIDNLDEYFSFLRSYDTQIIGCIQSYPQLRKLYGKDEADSFFQNTHVIFMGGQEPETLKKLEELTGTRGIVKNFSSSMVGGGAVRVGESENIIESAVVDRTELLYLEKGELFVKLSNCGPVILESYDSSKHPLALVKYVDAATGRYHRLNIDEMGPDFDPEEMGLKLVGVPATTHSDTGRDMNENDYLV